MRNGRNATKQLNISIVTVSNDDKPKNGKYKEKRIEEDFLRDRLGVNDGTLRRLHEFKEVGIKGKSDSSKSNRNFDTQYSPTVLCIEKTSDKNLQPNKKDGSLD